MRPVCGIGIGDVNGSVELAMHIPVIENVNSLGRAMITLLHLGSDRISPQRYFVGLKNLAMIQQLQGPFLL